MYIFFMLTGSSAIYSNTSVLSLIFHLTTGESERNDERKAKESKERSKRRSG